MVAKDRTGALVVCLAFFFWLAAGLAAQIRHRCERAEAFLRDASALQLRMATLVQVQQLVVKYGGEIQSTTCSPQKCAYFFGFDNGWLHRLHLAPHVRLTCTLGVGDGVLDYRRMFLTSGNTDAAFGAFVEERLFPPKGIPEPFYVSRQWEGSGEHWRVHVDLTTDATPEQRGLAYGLNVHCLSKIGGCKDAQELLPTVAWR